MSTIIGPVAARRYLVILLAPTILLMLGALFVNAYVDPYWIVPAFGERSSLRYCVDDERQNKIDKMVYGNITASGVLLGSSRSAFFDTTHFAEPVFNLAVNGLRPVEFPEYIKIFVKNVGPPKDIYLGLDFFGYILGRGDTVWIARAQEKEREANSMLYRAGLLLDMATLAKAISTVTVCSSARYETIPTHRYSGVRTVGRKPHIEKEFADQLDYFRKLYDLKTPIDTNFRTYLKRMKAASPQSKFHVYVPPLSAPLLRTLIEAGRADEYRDWLNIMVEEFGSLTEFSGFNSFAADLGNFYDTHHTYPELTRKMIEILDGQRRPDEDGFGQTLTREDITSFYDRNFPRS